MNFVVLVAGVVAIASCLAGIALLWRVKAYAVLAYLLALPVLQLVVLGFLPFGPRIVASAIGALVIAAPIALMQRKAKARATKTTL